jgi:hypothetical protein
MMNSEYRGPNPDPNTWNLTPSTTRWGGLPPDFLSGLFFREKSQEKFAGLFDLRQGRGERGSLRLVTSRYRAVQHHSFALGALGKKRQFKGL